MTIKDSQKLKQLQSQRDKLLQEVEFLDSEQREASRKYSKASTQLGGVLANIEALKEKEVIVTEHAVLRFLERKFKLDIDEIKTEIFPENVRAQHKALGSGKFPIANGLKAVIKNNSVVTVV